MKWGCEFAWNKDDCHHSGHNCFFTKTHKLDMVKKTATMRKKEDGSVTSFRMVRLSRNGPNGNGKPVMLK
jgi:hypothetical protein